MQTVNDLYKHSLALYDEISKNGEINISKTQDYKARTPMLADVLQKELWDTADYTKIIEFIYNTPCKLTKLTLPTDFKSINKIILSNDDEYVPYTSYEFEKDGINNYLYIRAEKEYTIKVHYKPYPVDILTINDNIQLDSITATGLAYGLCRYFAMSEQNEFVEKICNIKFNEIKNNKVKVPAHIQQINDVYGGF